MTDATHAGETAEHDTTAHETAAHTVAPGAPLNTLPPPPLQRYFLADVAPGEFEPDPGEEEPEQWVDAASAPEAAAYAERAYGREWLPSPRTGHKGFSRVEWLDPATGEARSMALTLEGAVADLAAVMEERDRRAGGSGAGGRA